MPAALSVKGQELLADMPLGAADPTIIGVIDALARELTRLEAAAAVVRAGFLPTAATDTSRMLGIWERLLGLPVEPAGPTVAQRQAKALAAFRKRRAAKGSDWVALLTAAIGSENWEHEEISPYRVAIVLPQSGASYTGAQVAALARDITPANLQVSVSFDVGFVLGQSVIGVGHL